MSGRPGIVDVASRLAGGEVSVVKLVHSAPGTVPRVWSVVADAGIFWLAEDGVIAELYARAPADCESWISDVPRGAIAVATEFRRRRLQRQAREMPAQAVGSKSVSPKGGLAEPRA